MFAITEKQVPVGVIEVRVRDANDTQGALLGYFPPEAIESLNTLFEVMPAYRIGADYGAIEGEMSSQFVVTDDRVYYEIVVGE